MVFERLLDEPDAHAHIVQFYESDEHVLVDNMVRYFAEGLKRGDNAIVISTRERSQQLSDGLLASGINVDAAVRSSRILWYDAHQTLSRILVDGHPSEARFEAIVASAVREALATSAGSLRAYGDMVGLLWQQKQFPAAIRLEQLWHKFTKEYDFALFCAYPIDIFAPDSDSAVIDALLCAHTHLVSAGPNGDVEAAVAAAIAEVIGASPTVTPLRGSAQGERASMPRGDGLIVWVRQNYPQHAAEILSRARENYARTRSV